MCRAAIQNSRIRDCGIMTIDGFRNAAASFGYWKFPVPGSRRFSGMCFTTSSIASRRTGRRAHAFRNGRSIRTFAAPHVGRAAVWRFELKDFFPSIPASRVQALFRVAGYPLNVARVLTGLCTTRLPFGLLAPDQLSLPSVFWDRHLPQGTPTSPALSNLAAYRLDVRLSAWAAECGATYTRVYADDLAFSGDEEFAAAAHRFRRTVFQIIVEEGFQINVAKSRWMTAGIRQHLAGVVVNQHPNVRRDEYDLLKAILTNCVRHGPVGQNLDSHADFRAHLAGRIAHIGSIHAERGRKLLEFFDRIDWVGVTEQ